MIAEISLWRRLLYGKIKNVNSNLKLMYINNDELILTGLTYEQLPSISQILDNYKYLDVTYFTLNHLGHNMYQKKYTFGATSSRTTNYDLKCVPKHFYAQVFKQLHDLPLIEKDKKFYIHKQNAYFENYIKINV